MLQQILFGQVCNLAGICCKQPVMLILAMDTSLGTCSVALYDATVARMLAAEDVLMDKGHAEALGPMVERVLEKANCSPADISRIGVTFGPGTFTGVRIGLSFAKGMAQGLGIPLVGIDTLSATAVPHLERDRSLAIVHQAGGTGKFYVGLYDGVAKLPIMPPEVLSIEELHLKLKDKRWLVAGTGAANFISAANVSIAATHAQPSAALFVAHLAGLQPDGQNLQPLYLREPDAKFNVASDRIQPRVRLADTGDLHVLAGIHAQCFESGWSVDQFQSALSLPGAAALIVELDQTAYGFIQFQQLLDEAEINTLCVLPNFRRQHFASELLQDMLDRLLEKNVSRVFLEVADDNKGALGLYEAHSFHRSGLRKSYYRRSDGRLEDAVTMTRVIARNN